MPKIATLDRGLTMHLYFEDHAPPHVHAKVPGEECLIVIKTREVLEGSIPAWALRLAKSWIAENETMLLEMWEDLSGR